MTGWFLPKIESVDFRALPIGDLARAKIFARQNAPPIQLSTSKNADEKSRWRGYRRGLAPQRWFFGPAMKCNPKANFRPGIARAMRAGRWQILARCRYREVAALRLRSGCDDRRPVVRASSIAARRNAQIAARLRK